MREWAHGIRQHLRLDGLDAKRQEEIVEDLAGQLEDAFQDAVSRGLSTGEAEKFAWDQCSDWDRLSRELRSSRRGAVGALERLQDNADAVPPATRSGLFLGWLSDLLFALRMLRKAPSLTAVVVLTLALGIGANSTIFSVISATLLKTLPFPDPERLVLVWQMQGKGFDNINIVSAPNFWDWQRQNRVFQHFALFDSAGRGYNLGANGDGREAEQVSGVRVTSEFFAVLGVRPFLGREFTREEETSGRDRVVVLSHGLWTRRYGADRGIVGRTIRLDGENYTVVGVMPAGFEFQFWSDRRELWVPAGWTAGDRSRSSNSFIAIARLRSGVTVAQADAEIAGIQRQLSQQFEEDRTTGAMVMPMAGYGLEGIGGVMLALFAAVALVLLIGCVNVANLMLARGAERRREFAIRRALGASAGRIVRQLLAESVLLSALGGVAGLALAYWAGLALTRVLPPDLATLPLRPLDAVGLDARVLVFTFVVTCVTGVVFGIAPAISAVRDDVAEPLKEGSRGAGPGGKNSLRHVLVAAEVSLALVVLAAAGLTIKSMVKLLAVDPGFDPRNVLTMGLSLPQENTYYGPPGHPRFCEELEDRVGTLPGVQSVSAAAHLPLRGNAGRSFHIEGRPVPALGDEPGGSYTVVCPGYFRTLGVRVLQGREFSRKDVLASPGVVVINQALAKRYWPGEDPVGRRISIDRDGTHWLTIVGVVGDVKHWGLARNVRPQLFRPYTQAAWPWLQVVVRTGVATAGMAAAVKKEVAAIEPDRPLSAPRTMEETIRGSVASRRFPMVMFAVFALLALVLAAVGIIGVVNYTVTQRTHEVGIRVALGAQRGSVVWLMVSASMRWVSIGLAAGALAALAVCRVLAGLLFEVQPADPWVLAAVAALLGATAFAATYLPARRATRVDPLVALRSE